jgi:hypothetical protein
MMFLYTFDLNSYEIKQISGMFTPQSRSLVCYPLGLAPSSKGDDTVIISYGEGDSSCVYMGLNPNQMLLPTIPSVDELNFTMLSDDLRTVSKKQTRNIIHHSPFPGGNASEYIVPGKSIIVTSHGMGSGIYGLSPQYLEKYPPENLEVNLGYVFTIDNAFIIQTEEECQTYIDGSMTLMRDLEALRQKSLSDPSIIITEKDMIPIALKFVELFPNFDLGMVTNALFQFWNDYHTRKDFVAMPINYVLNSFGFDGVSSNTDISCHAWSKGDVKFLSYPTLEIGEEVPVVFYLGRDGVTKPITDLTKYNYCKNDLFWKRTPLKVQNCRICSSPDHKAWFCPQRKQSLLPSTSIEKL